MLNVCFLKDGRVEVSADADNRLIRVTAPPSELAGLLPKATVEALSQRMAALIAVFAKAALYRVEFTNDDGTTWHTATREDIKEDTIPAEFKTILEAEGFISIMKCTESRFRIVTP